MYDQRLTEYGAIHYNDKGMLDQLKFILNLHKNHIISPQESIPAMIRACDRTEILMTGGFND